MNAEYQNRDQCPTADLDSIDEQVPVVDIAGLRLDSTSETAGAIADEIALACQSWGFFQVINHGISDQFIDAFLVNNGRIHIGNKQFLAPPFRGCANCID